jgi:hypothetical protein
MDQNPYESPHIPTDKRFSKSLSKASFIVPAAFAAPPLLLAAYCFYGAWWYVGSPEQNDHPFVQGHLSVGSGFLAVSVVIYAVAFIAGRFLAGKD